MSCATLMTFISICARAQMGLSRGAAPPRRRISPRPPARRKHLAWVEGCKMHMDGILSRVIATAVLIMSAASAPAQTTGLGGAIELVDADVLRVCADPNNMPFSNEAREGIENKLAEFLAPKLGRRSVAYTFFPQVTGFVRNTLGANKCDVIMGYPQGDELVQNTNPYYRTIYALVFKPGSGLDGVESLDDPRLKGKRIGIIAG